MTPELDSALSAIPDQYRKPLLASFEEIERSYRLNQWRPAELDGGRLSECVISIIHCQVAGSWGSGPSKPANMVDACRNVEQHNAIHGRSLCILIPRLLPALYEIRNNRNVGHVGGDVDPNEMDSRYVAFTARWIIAELVRIFHGVSIGEATKIVHACVQFDIPEVWAIGNVKRVMKTGLSAWQKSLVLLYSNNGTATVEELVAWIEYKNVSQFIGKVLTQLHVNRMIEFESKTRMAHLSPKGVVEAQRLISE